MSADEAKEPSGDSNRGVELFIVPYEGQEVYFDEELNMYRLRKRWPHQNTRPPRFQWTNEQWRQFRLQQQQRLRQRAKRATNVLPVVYQRPSVPSAGMDSNPDDSPPTRDENQMASCSTEKQSLNSSEESLIGSIEWHVVDEVLANAFDTQSSGSDSEKASDSQECDHIQESSPDSADCQSATSFDQLQDHSDEFHSLTPGEQMSPSLSDEQSLNSYEWQNPDPTEESSTNTAYYQSPDSGVKLQPRRTGLQCLETGEMIPNTTTDCEISSSVEQVLPSSTTEELSNSSEQHVSISNACMSDQVVPSSTKAYYSDSDEQKPYSSAASVSEQVISCYTEAEYSDTAEQQSSSSDACVSEQVQSIFTKEEHSNSAEQQPPSSATSVPQQITQAEYSDTAEQKSSSSAACVPEQVQSSLTKDQYSNLADQQPLSSAATVPQQILPSFTQAENSDTVEQQPSSSAASVSEEVKFSSTDEQYSDPAEQRACSSPDCVPLEVLYGSPQAQYSNPMQVVSSMAAWVLPNSSQYVPYYSSQWHPVTTYNMLSGNWQFSGWNGQQPYTPVPQQQSIPVQQLSIPVQQPISNFRGQQVLWSVPNVQAQMYGQQQARSPNSAIQTYQCLNGYPHKVTPCCSKSHRPPTPAPLPADSSQTPGALKPVHDTNMPQANNKIFYNVPQQAGSTSAPALQTPVPVPPPAIPPREWLEWWLRQLCTGKEPKEAETSESHAPDTDKKHSSSGGTSQERSSSFSSQGEELPSQDVVEEGREETGVDNMSDTAATVRNARQRDQQNFKVSCNVNHSEPERTQVVKSDQQQGDKGDERTAAKKSKKKRNKRRKKQQVQNLDSETSPAELQCRIYQEQTARSNRKKWQRNRAERRAPVKQTTTAGCSGGKKKGRWHRVPKQLQDLLSMSFVKDKERSQAGRHGDPSIDLGGPTPQESASRQRRRRRPPPPQPPPPRHADAHVDGPRPWAAARCSRCSSESPPSGLCYRCCCLGASSRLRRTGGDSRPSTERQQLQHRPQADRGEAAAELHVPNDALSASAEGSQASIASDHQQGRSQDKPPTPYPQTGMEGQGVGDSQVSRVITKERN